MKKIISSVLMFTMVVPISLVPAIALAVQPNATIDISSTTGNPCLEIPLTINGGGIIIPANDNQIDQYKVQVVWDVNDLVNGTQNNIPITLSSSASPFPYTFVAGPHSYSYTQTPPTTVTVRIYHVGVPGNDSQADSAEIVPTCPPNVAPVSNNQSVSTNEDVALPVTLTATDSDSGPSPLVYSIVSNPSSGALSGLNSATGAVTYTPNANYNGGDSFTFRVSDGSAFSNTATVSITVTPANDAPVSTGLSASVAEDSVLSSTVSATDIDGNTLTYATTTNPTNGTLTLNANTGAFTYTPNANYNGGDSFNFRANDGTANSNVSTVSVTVTPVNDAPVLANIPDQTVDELTALTFTASATDVDGNTITYSISGAQSGMSINSSTGEFSWTPTEVQGVGDYIITVIASDGTTTAWQNVDIHVNEVNVAPTTVGASVSTHVDVPKLITLSASDTDFPANVLTYIIDNFPINGTLGSIIGNQITYTPNSGYTGPDSFTFKVNDATVDSNVSTINISVDNGSPSISSVSDQTIAEEVAWNFTVTATDPDSDPLTFSLTGTVPAGLAITAGGDLSWTPTEAQGPNTYPVTVSVTDGVSVDSVSFNINVTEVNIAPVTEDDTISTDEDTSVNGNLSATDADLPENTLTYSIVTNPANGTVGNFDSATGAFTYTPNANYNGSDSFTYKANDETADSNVSTITVNIASVNDLPTITLNGSNSVSFYATSTPYADPGATGNDQEDGPLTPVTTGTVNTTTPGVYTLIYTVTDSSEAQASTTRTVTITSAPVENTQSLCSDSVDNDEDSLVDLADPDCSAFIPVPPTPPASSGGGGGNGPINYGVVNGASIGQVLGESCGLYMNKHVRLGSKKNDSEQVKKLQEFLNNHMGSTLPTTGFYGPLTFGIVKNFQTKYSDEILKPWGLTSATGLVYLSTLRQINNIECPEIMADLPALVPWSKNPNAQ